MKMETYLTSVFIRHTILYTEKCQEIGTRFFFHLVFIRQAAFKKKFATSRQDDKLAIGWIQNWREKKSRGHHFVGKGKKILLRDVWIFIL